MPSRLRYLIVATVLPVLAPLALAQDAEPAEEAAVKIKDPVKCIPTRSIKGTGVLDDQNLLFLMVGDTIYHNTLRKSCPQLARYAQFQYQSVAGRICDFDLITVLTSSDIASGASCRLGDFYRVTEEDLPALINDLRMQAEEVRRTTATDDKPEG